jgi:DNA invertase Pin-like site-specific DNA recombinase
MFNIIDAMVEFERALIQERLKAGIRNARERKTPGPTIESCGCRHSRNAAQPRNDLACDFESPGLGLRTVYRASNAF